MNYSLAKELKEAGFPVRPWPTCDLLEKWDFYPPTLSELIEACVEEGHWFNLHMYPNNGNVSWLATMSGEVFTGFDTLYGPGAESYETVQKRRGEGSTPEEAVARLWLALKKK